MSNLDDFKQSYIEHELLIKAIDKKNSIIELQELEKREEELFEQLKNFYFKNIKKEY